MHITKDLNSEYIQNYLSVMKPRKRFKTRQIFNINFTKVDILIVNNHMKKFKIIDQGSANENHSDLPQHFNQNGENKKGLITNKHWQGHEAIGALIHC